jgi:Uma2 family endonuclease
MAEAMIEVAPQSEKRLKMNYEAFLNYGDDATHAEWVNGEVIVFMPPTIIHQDVVTFLVSLLSLYAKLFDLGKVLTAPAEMRVAEGKSGREPDILFVARDHLHRLEEKRLAGPAYMIIEIISDESVERDRVDKFYEYQEASVPEYWLIDPRQGKERVDVYHLLPDGKYQAILPDDRGRYHSKILPDFWLKAEWLWQTELPDVFMVLAEIRGLSKEQATALRATLIGE